jgi:U32 family peptidase
MKILAPLRDSSEVEGLIEAGADEFFCGLTPPEWDSRFPGTWTSRRSNSSAGVAGMEEFSRIIARSQGRPVYVALNAHSYPAGAVAYLAEFGERLLDMGAGGLIVADMELILTLAEKVEGRRLHLSSLATCLNSESASFYRHLGISRIVLPRHLTLNEIEAVQAEGVEIEAFILNHGCVYEEGLCATTHAAGPFCMQDGEGETAISAETRERYAFWKWTLNHCGCRTGKTGFPLGPCGLCAIPRLLAAGVASLKVVGREASGERKVAAVRIAAHALRLARSGGLPRDISEAVAELRGMPEMCKEKHLCYYPDL